MKLSDLLTGMTEDTYTDIDIKGLSLDSRDIAPGYVFFAIPGTAQHGIHFADQAIKNGAVVVLYNPLGIDTKIPDEINGCIAIAIEKLPEKIGLLAARFYGFPAQKLNIFGITGTNGKTTCSQLLAQLLPDCGVIGTLGWGGTNHLHPLENTTPDAITIQKILHHLVDQDKRYVAMEVSSHGLEQGRVNGVEFSGVVFTNITRDHLDYHGSMEAYVQAKLNLLKVTGIAFVVINMDDLYADNIISATTENIRILGFSRQNRALENIKTLSASNIQFSLKGIECDLHWDKTCCRLHTPMVGEFNLENILAVLNVLLATGKNLPDAVQLVTDKLRPIDGRMERITNLTHSFQVFVDYAHTPDALERALKTLKLHCQNKLSVVFGCGGNRDQGKRSLMGAVATQLADEIIITDDNPRFEQPQKIIDDILSGCQQHQVTVINDRKSAIHQAISAANENDIVLIAGKGHENYQEIKGIKHPFNDRKIALDALNIRRALPC